MPKTKKPKAIKNATEAMKLLTEMESLVADAEALMVEHGINDKLERAQAIKAQVTEWAVENDVKSIPMPQGRYYGLRRDTYNKRVVGDRDELDALKDPTGVTPLKEIVKKKFGKGGKNGLPWTEVWKLITTRRVDMAKLEDAVKKDILTVEEIQPAYYQDMKAPYIRTYG